MGRRHVGKALLALTAGALVPFGSAEARDSTPTCEPIKTESGLEYCDFAVGQGEPAQPRTLIKAHYAGRLLDGTVFDSSYSRGRPLVFRVGAGEVIKGWDLGILGNEEIPPMKSGGKRTLSIPADLAYGARGAGCRGGSCIIPPNATLIFDVEYLGKA